MGADIQHLSYVQFHPTAFADHENRECFLVSEAVRGEGAYLLNCNKKRFMHKYEPEPVSYTHLDIILHVCDASDPEAREKAQTTLSLLSELGCGEIPVITVLNKCDKLDYELPPAENTVMISAKNGTGFDELLKAISDNLTDKVSRMEMLIPYDKSGLAAALHSHGKAVSYTHLDVYKRQDI